MTNFYPPLPPKPEPKKPAAVWKVIGLTFLGILFAAMVLGAIGNHQTATAYHGTVPSNSTYDGPATPPVHKAQGGPVTVSGSGEQVVTANLDEGGYTVQWRASGAAIIVEPVLTTGDEGLALINDGVHESGCSGSTTYRSTGVTTFKVSNDPGAWTLTFTPMS